LTIILLLALGLRLLLWSQPLHEPANDEVEYITVARDLLAGRGWSFYDTYHWLRAPLYPLFLAGSLWLAGGDLHLAALPNLALSVANVYLSYRLAAALLRRTDTHTGMPLLAALLTAVLWTNVTFASLYMAETLFAFLFKAGLLAALYAAGEGRRTVDQAGWAREPKGRWPLVLLAGVLFGLATLTRSITLFFLPVIGLWLLLAHAYPTPLAVFRLRSLVSDLWPVVRRRWLLPALFLAAAALTVAPWTARNWLAYGEPIAVETGLSYNMWLFNEPRESKDEIHRALERIENPAERADYATARGVERLREDPAILLRKLWPNWVFLTRVKPIQDRFLLESYYAVVELPLFVAALVLDDLLYVVIALAAIAGLVRATSRAGPGSPVWLVLAWVGYAVFTMLLTHGEARYRHFLFPVLIPFAAWQLVRWRSRNSSADTPRGLRKSAVVLALWAVFLWTVLTAYPWDWAGWNTARGWHTLAGDARWAVGDREGALASYGQAIQEHDVPDAWLRLGHARRAAGDLAGAAEAYRRAWRREPLYYPASTWYGDALRELGDEERARRAFGGSFADEGRVLGYAWRELSPVPVRRVDVGGGLDFGYVDGVYPAEEIDGASARWTDGRARIRLAASPGPAVLELRLAAPRLDGSTVTAEVCAAGTCHTLPLEHSWRAYRLPVAAPASGALEIEVRSATFAAPDGRVLGVLVDWARVSAER
jgi:hypothetical protein